MSFHQLLFSSREVKSRIDFTLSFVVVGSVLWRLHQFTVAFVVFQVPSHWLWQPAIRIFNFTFFFAFKEHTRILITCFVFIIDCFYIKDLNGAGYTILLSRLSLFLITSILHLLVRLIRNYWTFNQAFVLLCLFDLFINYDIFELVGHCLYQLRVHVFHKHLKTFLSVSIHLLDKADFSILSNIILLIKIIDWLSLQTLSILRKVRQLILVLIIVALSRSSRVKLSIGAFLNQKNITWVIHCSILEDWWRNFVVPASSLLVLFVPDAVRFFNDIDRNEAGWTLRYCTTSWWRSWHLIIYTSIL